MESHDHDPLVLVQRIHALVAELVERNVALTAEVEDLRDHIEGLKTKLTAAQAANHTLTQDTDLLLESEQEEMVARDTQRIERLRALLNEYLNDLDRPPQPPLKNVDQSH